MFLILGSWEYIILWNLFLLKTAAAISLKVKDYPLNK